MQRLIEAANESQQSPELNHAARGDSRPDYNRHKEHTSDALLLLERLRQAARDGEDPSTAELQREGTYALRPVNRLGDLAKGKYNRTRYDIERLFCSRGVYRWRLHEPPRPGYPKDKRQGTPALETPKQEIPWNERKPATGLELFDAAVR
jgi:hypothetical protein